MTWLLLTTLLACTGPSAEFPTTTDTKATTEATAPAPALPAAAPWTGSWDLRGNAFDGGTLTFSETTPTAAKVSLEVYSGSHMGSVEAQAAITGDQAVVTGEACELTIARSGELYAVVEKDCQMWHGAGVSFDGTYGPPLPKSAHPLLDAGAVATEAQEQIIRTLAKDRFEDFDVFMMVSDEKDEDGIGATVKSGAIRGLFSINEAIVMIGPDNKIWAAALQAKEPANEITYITNVPGAETTLPKTLDAWVKRFEGRTVVYGVK